MNISSQFSKDLKIQKFNYQFGESVDQALIFEYLSKLESFDLDLLITDKQKLAFWINIYNGLTNYLIIKLRIQKSMKEVDDIFKQKILNVGGFFFSLDEIEHGLLRRDKKLVLEGAPEKQKYMVAQLDYRIHFALNCGASSCPMIAYYTAENIDEELQSAESSFADSEFKIDEMTKTITCSSLYKWYREDFLAVYLDDKRYAGFEFIFKEYNWSI